jgi:threonine dehydratase
MRLSFNDILQAKNRIQNYIVKTPILTNQNLNLELNANIHFKCENFQTTGSFKLRGAANKILKFKEQNGYFPEKVVAVSSGNHAQAVAYLAKQFGIKALIYMEEKASPYKIKNTKDYGAQVILTRTKKETEILAEEKVKEGYLYVHSSNDEDIICGQGTACLESLQEIGDVDAVFAPCGGGGLIAGSYLACQNQNQKPQVFASEPKNANDTSISYQTGKIYSFDQTPKTIADGAKTLRPSAITFPYIKKLNGVYEISEEEIISWTTILSQNLNTPIEPTSALAIAGCKQFLQNKNGKQKRTPNILIIISGGNVDNTKII